MSLLMPLVSLVPLICPQNMDIMDDFCANKLPFSLILIVHFTSKRLSFLLRLCHY